MNIEELRNLYLVQNKTVKEIAEMTGYSVHQIRGYLRRNGIRKTELKLGDKIYDNKDWLYNEYVVKGKGYSKIAEELGVNYMVILERLRYFGFYVRGHKDIDKGAPSRGRKRSKETIEKIKKTRVRNQVEVICEKCKKHFMKHRSRVLSSKTNKHFCSWNCYKDYLRENRKSLESYQNIRHSTQYKEWRLAVYRRDNFKCQMPDCKNRNSRDINAHHILPIRDYPEKIFDVQNGITLCEDCHKKVNLNEYAYVDMLVRIVQK